MIPVYYKFEVLSDVLKEANGIKVNAKKTRLDCTKVADNTPGGYEGLNPLINNKGMLYLSLTETRNVTNNDSKRRAYYCLTTSKINFTSLYIEDLTNPGFAYGYPNPNPKLQNGEDNPMFLYRDDGYLFIISPTYKQIELIVYPDGKHLIYAYYQKLLDGTMSKTIEALREDAKDFFDYRKCFEGMAFSNEDDETITD